MARSYTIGKLLEHVLRENAGELHVLPGRPPFLILGKEHVAVGSDSITDDNIADLLYNLATVEQMRELNICGDSQFIYLFRNWARFAVNASIAHDSFSIKIRNLGR